MRYARFRSDKAIRVLGDPREATRADRHQIDGPLAGVGPLPAGAGRSNRAASGGRGVAGMTVREHRERQRAARRRASKVPGRIAAAALILFALVAIAFLVYQSPLFTVREVRVEGAQRLTGERLSELAAIPEGSTLLRLDTEGIAGRLEADPWVASVEVQRSFPSTVLLTVKEREIAATVEIPAAQSGTPSQHWLVSKDSVWLGSFNLGVPQPAEGTTAGADGEEAAATEGEQGGEQNAADAGAQDTGADAGAGADANADANADAGANAGANAQQGADQASAASKPHDEPSVLEGVWVTAAEIEQFVPIRDVPQSLVPKTGDTADDEGVLNALAIINAATPDMRALIRSISAPDRVKTMMTLTNNVEVAFGAAEDIGAKEQVILRLLAEHEGTITYINVRVADRATYRATE
jgi:cell division septal protein FtsQ